MKKLMLIVNPNAGKGAYRFNFVEALNVLDRADYNITLFFTKNRGDATEFVAKHGEHFDAVVCIGGDGTLSEVMSGLMHIERKPDLGYIPMGTANDVATTLNLPKNDVLGAVQRFLDGSAHPYDVGGFGKDKHFAYIAAFGAFTEASYATPQSQKKIFGNLAYVIQGAMLLPKIHSYHTIVEYDEGVIEADLMYGSMSNSTSAAGIFRLPEHFVSLGDGRSELILIKDPGNIEGLSEMLTSVITQRYDSDKILILHTKHAKFTFDEPVAWTRDGEEGGEHREVELYNHHAPINMIF
ncbi:MAG: YegS/Rv2252/BmrU family lipid kinase [Oscillospiraceae bacterium]|nr:YegS/Rv2252/BmrU family lipid kinase [Oscillospiraceae bacterium]